MHPYPERVEINDWNFRGGLPNVWWGNVKEGDHLEDVDVGWRIILKQKLKEKNVIALTGFLCSG